MHGTSSSTPPKWIDGTSKSKGSERIHGTDPRPAARTARSPSRPSREGVGVGMGFTNHESPVANYEITFGSHPLLASPLKGKESKGRSGWAWDMRMALGSNLPRVLP